MTNLFYQCSPKKIKKIGQESLLRKYFYLYKSKNSYYPKTNINYI